MELIGSALATAVSWLTHVLIEFTLFIAVDSVVKTSLHSLRAPRERRKMWFLESLVLLFIATVMSQYDRVPYILYILGFSTFLSAVLHDRVKWHNLKPAKFASTDAIHNDLQNGMLSPIDNSNPSGLDQLSPSATVAIKIKIKSALDKCMSYIAVIFHRKSSGCTPPGLPNKGMNLCFLNTVLQCLAHVQSWEDVDETTPQMRDRCKERDLTDCYSELVANCTARRHYGTVLDTFAFRKAASELCPRMIADPMSSQKQTQQDAAEFLMWLLSTLHNFLRKHAVTVHSRVFQTNSALEDLSEKERRALKGECQTLLQTARSMYDERCVKAVKVLSDLDWKHQRSCETSIVNSLFTGQMLELREDASHKCVSLSIQAFNVLPVPLSEPRQVSGVVYLQDCISDMCALTDVLVGLPSTSLTSPVTEQKRNIGCSDNDKVNILSAKHISSSVTSSISTRPEVLTSISQSQNRRRSREFQCQTSLRYLPKCLIIQLNRFNQYGRKSKTPVNIPIQGLNLMPALFDQLVAGLPLSVSPKYMYDLAAVCVHEGAASTSYGHYVAFCLASNGHWYRMDDETVSEVNMLFECNAPLVRENAYLLFYVRRT